MPQKSLLKSPAVEVEMLERRPHEEGERFKVTELRDKYS